MGSNRAGEKRKARLKRASKETQRLKKSKKGLENQPQFAQFVRRFQRVD